MLIVPYFVYWLIVKDFFHYLDYCNTTSPEQSGYCLTKSQCSEVKGTEIESCGEEKSGPVCCKIYVEFYNATYYIPEFFVKKTETLMKTKIFSAEDYCSSRIDYGNRGLTSERKQRTIVYDPNVKISRSPDKILLTINAIFRADNPYTPLMKYFGTSHLYAVTFYRYGDDNSKNQTSNQSESNTTVDIPYILVNPEENFFIDSFLSNKSSELNRDNWFPDFKLPEESTEERKKRSLSNNDCKQLEATHGTRQWKDSNDVWRRVEVNDVVLSESEQTLDIQKHDTFEMRKRKGDSEDVEILIQSRDMRKQFTDMFEQIDETDGKHQLHNDAEVKEITFDMHSLMSEAKDPADSESTNYKTEINLDINVVNDLSMQQSDVIHNLRKAVQNEDDHDMRKPVANHITHNMRKPVEVEANHDERKPITVHATNDMRIPVTSHFTHNMRKSVYTDVTHNKLESVQNEATHHMRNPVTREESHDLRWPVIETDTSDLRTNSKSDAFGNSFLKKTGISSKFENVEDNVDLRQGKEEFNLRQNLDQVISHCTRFSYSSKNANFEKFSKIQNEERQLKFSDLWRNASTVCGRASEKMDISRGKFPWMMSLQEKMYGRYRHKCGASLLNNMWVVSVAHCVDMKPKENFMLLLETEGLKLQIDSTYIEMSVDEIIIHPKFNRRLLEYDIALLRTKVPTEFQAAISPVCLPWNVGELEGETAVFFGWKLSERRTTPKQLNVPVMTSYKCEILYSSDKRKEKGSDTFFCEGVKDVACDGESGSSLTILDTEGRWSLIGLVSWGSRCIESEQPAIYISVSRYAQWIMDVIDCYESILKLIF